MRIFIAVGLILSLAACSTVYRSARVNPAFNEDAKVRVVRMTSESVVQANRANYTPRTLPAIFSLTAGTGSGAPRGAGTLPTPTRLEEQRPGQLALRVPPAANPGPYTIGVGDVVLLSTPTAGSTVEELTGLLAAANSRQGYTVQDDGTINIPNVGRILLADMTIESAEDELFQRLVENQIDPTFSLEIAEFNSRRVSIGGAVGQPAVVPITLTPLYLSEALAAAGGITVEDQDYASVRIYREGSLYQIPLNELLSDPRLQRTRLVQGDTIYVDTEYELAQAETYFEQQIKIVEARQQARVAALNELNAEVALRRGQLEEARSNYVTALELGADNRDYVFLAGEVTKQSRWALPLERRASLADALYDTASGVAPKTGDISQIYVLRASQDPREFGAVTAWHLDLRNAANLSLATRFLLHSEDVIFVAEQPVTRWNRAVQQMVPSLLSTTVSAATN